MSTLTEASLAKPNLTWSTNPLNSFRRADKPLTSRNSVPPEVRNIGALVHAGPRMGISGFAAVFLVDIVQSVANVDSRREAEI